MRREHVNRLVVVPFVVSSCVIAVTWAHASEKDPREHGYAMGQQQRQLNA